MLLINKILFQQWNHNMKTKEQFQQLGEDVAGKQIKDGRDWHM